MAGATLQWTTALADSVTTGVSDLTRNLRDHFRFHMIGQEEDSVTVPWSQDSLAMTDVTAGTPADTSTGDDDYAFSGLKITPTPATLKVPIPIRHLRNASDAQIEDLRDQMILASMKKIYAKIGTAIGAVSAEATHAAETGAALSLANLRAAKWALLKKENPMGLSFLGTAQAGEDVEEEFITKGVDKAGTLGERAYTQGAGRVIPYSGMNLFFDVYLGNDGTDGYNWLGTPDSLHVVVIGGEDIQTFPVNDAVHTRLVLPLWSGVGIPNDKKGLWVKSKA